MIEIAGGGAPRTKVRFRPGSHGGIPVSEVVRRRAVAGRDFEFEDRGEVELKGFDQPVRAWAVRWER